ncbi:MAG: hypothetical protein KF905_09365 [Flavobacteriales bacterium]|nr:hypothetical protein [Flavobacteriales bacterium]
MAVTFNIIPPYSAYVYDYADLSGQAVITLTNLTSQPIDARLEGILTNTTNGLFVRTNPDHRGPLPISLPPNGTVVLSTQPGVMDFLDPQVVTTNATAQDEQAIVQTGQLPEGLYRFCVEVYDYNGPQLLSVPNAGCTSFNLQYANPPLIVQPANGQQLSPYMVNPVFTWTPPLGNLAGAMIQYELVVTPVFQGQDPNDAIIAARTYRRGQPVLVKQGLMNTVYVRQPSDLPFEQGKTYVMQVTARDVNNNVAISNLGRSEISVFSVGVGITLPTIPVPGGTTPGLVPILDPAIAPGFLATTLYGKLRYYWPTQGSYTTNTIDLPTGVLGGGGQQGSGTGGLELGNLAGAIQQSGVQSGIGQQSTNFSGINVSGASGSGTSAGTMTMGAGAQGWSANVQQAPGGLVTQLTDDPSTGGFNMATFHGNRGYFGSFQQSPLPGVTVQLVQAIQVKGNVSFNPGVNTKVLPGNIIVPNGQIWTANGQHISLPVLATSTTSGDGSFMFNVPNLQSLDMEWKQGGLNWNNTFGGEFHGGIHCTEWRRVLMVRIDNAAQQYYAQPVQFNAGLPANGDLGLFHARVRTFGVRVLVTENLDKSQVKNNMEVLLMRKKGTRPSIAPKDELSPGQHQLLAQQITVSGNQYEILAKGITNANGEVDFHHLVRFDDPNGGGNNLYYTHVRPVDDFTTQWSIFNHVRVLPYAYHSSWTCKGPNYSFVHVDCVPSGLANHGNGAYSTWDDEHPAGYKPGPTWLYNMSFVSKMRPQVSATVKNSGAGEQSGMAMNEPGVNWVLWRISEQAMALMRDVSTGRKWGANLESTPNHGWNMLQQYVNNNGHSMQPARIGSTGADGRIHEKELWSNGTQNNVFSSKFFYALTLQKNGFNPLVRAVFRQDAVNPESGDMGALVWGHNYNEGELWMQPRGTVRIDLVNEEGQPIAGKAYYFDPATGQQGVMRNSVPVIIPGQPYAQMVELAVPSGAGRKIVVVPNDPNVYDRDTLTVNVPGTGVLKMVATIPYKLHRIHFHIVPETTSGLSVVVPRIAGAKVVLVNNNGVMYPNIAHPETEFEGAMAEALQGGGASSGGGQGSGQQAGGGTQTGQSGIGLSGVQLSGLGSQLAGIQIDPYTRYANAAGAVDFAFRSAGTRFTFRIYSPDDKEYITREVEVTSSPGKHWQVQEVTMKLGRKVRGRVMLDSAVVAGARVTTAYDNMVNEVFSGSDGWYEMRRVPKDELLTFTASKGNCNCVGMEFTEGQASTNLFGLVNYSPLLQNQNDPHTRIDFRLKIYGDLDFRRLNDFPIEVTAFDELPGSQARINGWLMVPDSSNTVFRLTTASSEGNKLDAVRFVQTMVEPSVLVNEQNIPLAKPVVDPMPLAVNYVSVGMFRRPGNNFNYHAVLHDEQQGITVARPDNGTRGAVQGRVKVSLGSFTDNNFSLGGTEHFALMHPSVQGQLRVNTFGSDATSFHPESTAFRVGDLNGQALNYMLHGFQANSLHANTRLHRDSLVLDTRLRTALANIPAPANDLNIHIGKITLSSGQLLPFQAQRQFSIPLGQFQFEGSELSMNSGGFGFKGILNASGMELPVENGSLQPTSFSFGQLPVEGMKLIGAVPIVAHRPAVFGYDAVRPTPAWFLAVTSGDHNVAGAEIRGEHLDGIPNDRNVPITSIWLYSNGDQEASLSQDMQPYPVHGIVSASLQSLILSPNLLVLTAGLEMGIPQFPVYTTALVYDKQGEGTGPMTLQPFSMSPLNFNGIQLAFDKPSAKGQYNHVGSSASIQFQPGRMTITGVISDENPNVFKNLAYTLVKDQQQTKLTLDRSPQQSVRLGGDNPSSRILMTDVEGEMWVAQQGGGPQWNHFYIKGNMPEEMGFEPQNGQPQRMRFEVYGDLQVQSQQVKLKDIETPFGNINMVYDAQHHRLAGQLNVSHSVSGGPSMNGSVAIVLDREGYYFMSGLNVQMSNPDMQGMAFLLLGDYAKRTVAMDAMLLQYSLYAHRMIERKNSPAMLQMVLPMLASMPDVGVGMAQGVTDGQALPTAYTALFGSGRFNGFFLECGASIPFPLLPNFSIDCSPIAHVYFGVNMGADVRLGANFGSGTYTVGFDTFMDAAIGGGASMGAFCLSGRIGVYFTIGMNGVFHTNGNWNVQANGNLDLTGSFNIGGGICSVPCNDWTCLHVTVGGSVGMGLVGDFSNSGSDFRIIMGSDNTTSSVHEPPPETEN